jgi:small subunit ribosomal protein S17
MADESKDMEETTPEHETPAEEAAEEPVAEVEQPEPEAEAEPATEAEAEQPEAAAAGEDGDEPAPEPAEDESAAEAAAESEEPPAEASAEEVDGDEEPAEAEAPPAAPAKKKRKRLPRSERRQRPKLVREKPAARKPLARAPKPAAERGRTVERRGVVVSSAMDKTIIVRVETLKAHPRYKKIIRRSTKFHAHDERNEANVGDVVRIVETRPLSKTKRWRLVEVVEAAK